MTLFAYERVSNYDQANQLLEQELAHHNQNHRHATTGLTPNQAWEKALQQGRSKLQPVPDEKLLNPPFCPAHPAAREFSQHRCVPWPHLKYQPHCTQKGPIVHHPEKRFWITAPAKLPTTWPDILGSYSL